MADGISSARARLFIVPPDGSKPFSIGYVEQFRTDKRYQPDVINEIGQGPAVEVIPTTENGMVSWGRVRRFNDQAVLDATRPRIAQWTKYRTYNLLVIDPDTGKSIALAVGIAPQSIDMTTQNGRAVRENYQGACKYVLTGDEIQEAALAEAA